MKASYLAATFLIMFAEASFAAELHFASGAQQTSLLELYTSEGCSSCPPAEAWLSRLKENAGLWKQFVPVAYHVDYWDHLGWRDRFSSKDYTDRQSLYAALWHSESVYTPAFVLNGKEWRSWSGVGAPSPNESPAGLLSATSGDGKTWSIEFRPADADEGAWEAHVALLGAGISSKVGAGENSGRDLKHDFVALEEKSGPMKRGAKAAHAEITLSGALVADVPQKGVAIWVSRRGQLPAVQATGGWLAAQ